jgi:lipopolysaccharide export system permease protein
MRLADRYILRNHVGPFFLGLSVLTFVLVIDMFYRLLELFLVNKVPAIVVLELVLLSLGHIFALSIPMAVLIATMLAFTQMMAENEITAMRAGGISLYRIIAAPVVAALLLTAFMFMFNNFVLPETNHRLKNLLIAVRSKRPELDIRSGRFIQSLPGYTIYVNEKDEVSGKLYDLLIFKEAKAKGPMVITASEAEFQQEKETGQLRMVLHDGEQFEASLTESSEFQITVFDSMHIMMSNIDSDLKRQEQEYRGDREMSIAMMRSKVAENHREVARLQKRLTDVSINQVDKILGLLDQETRRSYFESRGLSVAGKEISSVKVKNLRKRKNARRVLDEENTLRTLSNSMLSLGAKDKRIKRFQVEIHKKYAIPVACLVFIMIGAPIAIKTGRGGMGWGISFSMLTFAVYYIFLIGGEQMADRRTLPPWIAMWAANIILFFFGLWMLYWTNRESRPFSLLSRLTTWIDNRKGWRS